jgi:hypothetical protein
MMPTETLTASLYTPVHDHASPNGSSNQLPPPGCGGGLGGPGLDTTSSGPERPGIRRAGLWLDTHCMIESIEQHGYRTVVGDA